MGSKIDYKQIITQGIIDHQYSMDEVHGKMIEDFIRLSGISNVVEVGCAYGLSTAYIMTGLNNSGELTLIDIKFTESVNYLTDVINDGIKINKYECASLCDNVLTKHINNNTLVLLDGDHSVQNVMSEISALLGGTFPSAIVLHDTGTKNELQGPRLGEEALKHNGYIIVKDEADRPGMRTHRGLSICVLPMHLVAAKMALAGNGVI